MPLISCTWSTSGGGSISTSTLRHNECCDIFSRVAGLLEAKMLLVGILQ
jgi:hypothetical protein